MSESLHLSAEIPEDYADLRLDQALARLFPDYSRSKIQEWIKIGQVKINGEITTITRGHVSGGETVEIEAAIENQGEWQAQDIPLEIVYDDESLIVINKPAGLVVHPAAGNPDKTLVNALLHFDPSLQKLPRAGIVHRIDKDTTGLLVIARSLEAHTSLVDQLQSRSMHRQYEAVVNGVMTAGGTVDAPIARHPRDRKRMAVVKSGKHAVTHYRVLEKFPAHTHIKVNLETGRTHQIRVHMSHINYPIVGDPVYGGRFKIPKNASEDLINYLKHFKRQALHAKKLQLIHPKTKKQVTWTAPLPEDMQELLLKLKTDNESN